VVTMVVGVWPAFAVSRSRSDAMRTAASVRGAAGASRASSGLLVAAQVTVAVVLLAGTGAAIRALIELTRAPLGYDPTNVTVAQIHLPVAGYTAWPARAALYQRLRSEVRGESVVDSAARSRGGVAGRSRQCSNHH